jgi:hypothetical protein
VKTPWGRKASYGAELYKRKRTAEGARSSRKEKKRSWWIWAWAAVAGFLAISPQTLGLTSGETKYFAGLAAFFVVWGIVRSAK